MSGLLYASANAQCECYSLEQCRQLLQLQTNLISPCPLSSRNTNIERMPLLKDCSNLSGLLVGNGYTMMKNMILLSVYFQAGMHRQQAPFCYQPGEDVYGSLHKIYSS